MAAHPSGIPPNIRQALPEPMKYAAQAVWCLDPLDTEMGYMSDTLHGKRMAAGEESKSAIVQGWTPRWPFPDAAGDIRLYVVAHGVKVDGEEPVNLVQIYLGSGKFHTASEFFPYLRDFVQQAPQHRVKRISLVMCNSAGIRGEVTVGQSFAKQLADLCGGLTTDIVGRQGEVDVRRDAYPTAEIDRNFPPGRNPLRLFTFMAPQGRGQHYIVNAHKEVRSRVEWYPRFLTYVFKPNQTPELKPRYRDNLDSE